MPSFGAKLKQQRELRGVTLEEISQSTKIGSRFLRALEDDRFDQLPGGIFNKGFVRAYARSVGLDEDEAVAGYLEATGTSSEKPEAPIELPEIRGEGTAESSELPWGTLALVLLVVALALAIWGFHSRQAATRSEPTPPVSPNVPLPEKAAASGSPQQIATLTTTRQKPSQIPAAKASPSVKVPSNSASAQPVNLQIRVRQESWISIVADGKQITRGTIPADSQRSVQASNQIVVRAGNIGAVDFEFNGTRLPMQGADGEAKTLIFDASGFHPAPPQPAQVSGEGNNPPQ